MLNDIDFDYPDLGLPNLVWAKDKAKTYDKPVKLGMKLAPLAYEAAKKFPKWKFIGVTTWEYDNNLSVTSLNVYEGREKIGNIGTTVTRQGTKYTVRNERIQRGRKRGSAAETNDIKKALKLMTKSFGGKTITEKTDEAWGKIYNAMSSGNTSTTSKYHTSLHHLQSKLVPYILDNFETVSAAAIATGAKPEVINNLLTYKEHYDVTSKIMETFSLNKGNLVLLDGDKYVLHRNNDGTLVLFNDTVPSDLKGKLGMLKLLEDNNFLKDVGYRLNNATFFVLDGEP